MTAALLTAVLLVHSSPTPAVDVLIEDWRVVVTVYRPDNARRVRSVVLQPEAGPKDRKAGRKDLKPAPVTHHTRVTGATELRLTFEPVPMPFHVIVVLDDGSVHRLFRRDWNRPGVRSPKPIRAIHRDWKATRDS